MGINAFAVGGCHEVAKLQSVQRSVSGTGRPRLSTATGASRSFFCSVSSAKRVVLFVCISVLMLCGSRHSVHTVPRPRSRACKSRWYKAISECKVSRSIFHCGSSDVYLLQCVTRTLYRNLNKCRGTRKRASTDTNSGRVNRYSNQSLSTGLEPGSVVQACNRALARSYNDSPVHSRLGIRFCLSIRERS